MGEYNLDYVKSKNIKVLFGDRNKKKSLFKIISCHILTVILCVNFFIVFIGKVDGFFYAKNIVSTFSPTNETFGKLKFVFNELDENVSTSGAVAVNLNKPFQICKYDKELQIFNSFANGLLFAVCDGEIYKNIVDNGIKKVTLKNKDLCVDYVGRFFIFYKVGDSIKAGQKFGYCEDLQIKLKIVFGEQSFEFSSLF